MHRVLFSNGVSVLAAALLDTIHEMLLLTGLDASCVSMIYGNLLAFLSIGTIGYCVREMVHTRKRTLVFLTVIPVWFLCSGMIYDPKMYHATLFFFGVETWGLCLFHRVHTTRAA